MTMKNLYKILIGVLLLSFTVACSDKEESLPDGSFRVEDQYLSLNFTQDAQYQFIPVQSNVLESEWDITTSASWCVAGASISGAKGLMISVEENQEMLSRTAKVYVRVAGNAYLFTVQQLGYGPALIVKDMFINAEGGTAELSITSNVPFDVAEPVLDAEDIVEGEDAWITKVLVTKSLAETKFVYSIQPNFTAGKRYATIAVTPTDRTLGDIDATCSVTQDYLAPEAGNVFGTATEFTILSAKAIKGDNEEYYSKLEVVQTGKGSPDMMFDGNAETYYHSPRNPGGATSDQYKEYGTELPFSLEFEMADEGQADFVEFTYTGSIGRPKSFKIYSKETASAEPVAVGSFSGSAGGATTEKFYFDAPINPKYIVIEILEAYESSNRIRLAEVKFCDSHRATVEEELLKVFTDYSCTELRSGIKKSDINALALVAPSIAKNIAMPLYQNTYTDEEKEFRIHGYEPYSVTSAMKKKYNTRLYTELDNPTGVLVRNGETVTVCVGDIPAGHTVKFAVNGDNSAATEFNYGVSQFTQTLHAGVNVVEVSLSGIEEGLVFIIHTDDNLTPASEPVTVHIAPGAGQVVGYFDLSRHDDARFKDMFAKYPYKYFIQKGRNVILAFHTSALRKPATQNGMSSGLGFFDQIYDWEWDLMGLHDQTDFNNHILVISSEDEKAYMDAGDRRVRVGAKTVGNYATAEMMMDNAGAGPWGIAHEIGHVNQPAICWESNIESSNNLFSNYCIYNSGIKESRGHSLISLANSCGLPWVKLGDTGQYQNEDAELHMRMFWQLWNYYHKILGMTSFYPTIFQLVREHPVPNMNAGLYGFDKQDPGVCQLAFYENACDAAQQDLTEFFETWGFFREVSIAAYSQYESSNPPFYNVTTDMIAESKARVAAKNYPKAPAIQYLEDRTRSTRSSSDPGYMKDIRMGYLTVFQDKVEMTTVPKYTLSGRNVTITNYEKAAAVEIRSTVDGELLSSCTVPLNFSSW